MRKFPLRALAYVGAVVLGAIALVLVSAVAALAAREARGTSHDVRASTDLWNAYQQARYSVVQEALLTQDFRLAASPYFEQRFEREAANLERALQVVEKATPADARLADQARGTNAQLARAITALVDAVNAGDAPRAEQIARKRLDPLFRSAIATVERGAEAHQAESRVGLEAAESAAASLRRSALAVVLLALLLSATAALAIRLRRRLDEARRLELERLRNVAFRDSLTGAQNHRAFHEQLEPLLESASPEEPISLLLLDLDGLKRVNDRYGHQAGDERIRLLSSAAHGATADPDRVYRLGGDEFALVLCNCVGARAVALTDRIDEVFRRSAPTDDVSFSAGIAVWEEGVTKDELIRRADLALIEAKRLHQLALVYAPAFEVAVLDEPADQRQAQVLANALARAVDTKDAYTNSHCETVAELCALMAVELGFDDERVFKIRLAGLLHDVGKIGVPDSILQKPGRLTDAEFDLMKAHPVLGAHILAAAELHDEADWVLAHHERPDGKGYPNGGMATPLEARIISVADAFEAIVSDRPYREARTASEALAELVRCADTQFDRRCVRALSVVLGTPIDEEEDPMQRSPARQLPLPLGAAA
jgi:diguanylate cyclase (GGDEF)-like protein/putative nucleotidyltransferase with HDIG domain